MNQPLAKRCLDLLLSSLLLLLCAPAFLVVVICIRLDSHGPAFFRQKRVGLAGKEFELFKFRTMLDCRDEVHREYVREWMHSGEGARQRNGEFKLAEDQRITSIGRLLRRYSIDELPQLINVLCGEMSLVGPRPALAYEVADYEPWQRERLGVRPGITGLWQVSGRNQLSFHEMVVLDIQYVQLGSFWNDLYILLRTIPTVLRGTGH